jgi:hypothetical protein
MSFSSSFLLITQVMSFSSALWVHSAAMEASQKKKKTWAASVMQNSPLSEWILCGAWWVGSQDFCKKLWGSQHSGAPTPPQQMQKKKVK